MWWTLGRRCELAFYYVLWSILVLSSSFTPLFKCTSFLFTFWQSKLIESASLTWPWHLLIKRLNFFLSSWNLERLGLLWPRGYVEATGYQSRSNFNWPSLFCLLPPGALSCHGKLFSHSAGKGSHAEEHRTCE